MIILGVFALAGCVAQSGSKPSSKRVPDNFHALMPPQSLLREDTVKAATHDRSASRLAYVGVWARSGEACAMMDQTAFDGYAVITPGGLRQSGSACTFEPGAPARSSQRFEASCKAGRKTVSQTLMLEMENSERLRLTRAGQSAVLVRCHLPE